MHYIINPFLIYIIEVIGSLGFTLCLFAWILILYTSYNMIKVPYLKYEIKNYPLTSRDNNAKDKLESAENFNSKHLKRLIIGTVVFCLVQSFIPTTEVMYKMLVASMVTTESISTVQGDAKELVDYITDSVKEIIQESEK